MKPLVLSLFVFTTTLAFCQKQEPVSFRKRVELAIKPDDIFGLVAMGGPSQIHRQNGNPVTANAQAKELLKNPIYTPGRTVTLLMNNAGFGNHSYAQQLADELTRQSGLTTDVIAPSTFIWFDSKGTFWAADQRIKMSPTNALSELSAPVPWKKFKGNSNEPPALIPPIDNPFNKDDPPLSGMEKYYVSPMQFTLLLRRVEEDDAGAAYGLYVYYAQFNNDQKSAAYWLEKSVELGNEKDRERLDVLLEWLEANPDLEYKSHGIIWSTIKIDSAKFCISPDRIAQLVQALEQGDSQAPYRMACFYLGYVNDIDFGKFWMGKAEKMGHEIAMETMEIVRKHEKSTNINK